MDLEEQLARRLARTDDSPADRDAHLDAVLSSLLDFAYAFDADGRCIYLNPAMIDYWQIQRADVLGKTFFEQNYPQALAGRLHSQLRQVWETRRPVRDEMNFGQLACYEYVFVPAFDRGGHVEAVVGVTRDVTERRQAEEQRRAEDDRLRDVLESITDAFFALDGDWRFSYVNRQAETLLNRTPGELLGQVVWDAFPGLMGSAFETAYRRTVRERVATSLTEFYPDHNRWYEVRAFPAPDGITVYFRDVTDRRQGEEALRTSEERYRTLFERMDEGYCVVEMLFDGGEEAIDYRFLEVNPAFETQTGLRDATGRRMRELAPEHEEYWFEIYGRVARTGEPVRFVNLARSLNHRWFDAYAFRLGAPGSRRVAILFTDVTERIQSQVEMADLNAQLRRSMTETHHRVKNNLQIISALVDMQALAAQGGSVPVQEFERLGRQIATLAAVHDLLTTQSKEDGQVEWVSARAILGKLLPLLQRIAADHPFAFRMGSDARLTLRQGTSLALVANELVTNAVKHGAGGVDVRFEIVDGAATLEVSDRGPGFPEGFDPRAVAHTGLELVEHLASWDLDGGVVYGNRADGGAQVVATFAVEAV